MHSRQFPPHRLLGLDMWAAQRKERSERGVAVRLQNADFARADPRNSSHLLSSTVKKTRESFQKAPPISGFSSAPPSFPEMRASDFRNVCFQASISISGFNCISAYRALDFKFDPRSHLSHAEMQSNACISISALETNLPTQNCNRTPRFQFQPSISEVSRKM